MDHFKGVKVAVSIKMDGENTTIGKTYSHSRSVDSGNHVSRDWVKTWAGSFQYLLSEGERVCGENLYARHTIAYNNLISYFYGYSLWQDDECLSWEETVARFSELDVTPVTVIYFGVYDESLIRKLCEKVVRDGEEGVVIRSAEAFKYRDFKHRVAKYVRKNHVQTDQHWMHQEVVKNKLASMWVD